MEHGKTNKRTVFAVGVFLLAAMFYVSQAVLYIYQAYYRLGASRRYHSDLFCYMDWIKDGTPIYSMVGDVLKVAYRLGGEVCVGIILALFALFAMYAAYRALTLCTGREDSLLLLFAALISQAAFNAYIPGRFFYWGLYLTVNNFHSPTYILMEPFAILAMACLFSLLPKLREKPDTKALVVFAICCTLSTYAKPSFLFCMAPALLLYLIVDFILTKGRNVKNEVLIGLCVLPGVAVALYQSTMLFDESSTILFKPVWNLLRIWKSFLEGGFRAGIFASAVLLLYGAKYMKTHWFSFSYLVAAIGLAEYLCLVETGKRADDRNLAWSAQIGLYFALLAGIAVLIKEKGTWKKPQWLFCAALLLWQLVSGILYYLLMLAGRSYAI